MHVGQKVQDGGTLQDSGLDTGNSSDFFFFSGCWPTALVSYPPFHFPDQSPAILRSQGTRGPFFPERIFIRSF